MRILRALVTLLFALPGLPLRWWRARRAPSWVRFRMQGDVPYRAGRRGWLSRWGPSLGVVDLVSFARQLEALGTDARIRGIVIEARGFGGSAAKRQAIARLLDRLRAQGKRVVGFGTWLSLSDYELLCCCDEVYLAPAGRIELTGVVAEPMVLGAALGVLGVRAHFVRRGEFKTAPELFTDEQVSKAQIQTVEAVLEARYEDLLGVLCAGRRKTREEAIACVDEGPYSAPRALAAGLVDALVAEADLGARLLGLEDPEAPRAKRALGGFDGYSRSCVLPPLSKLRRARPAAVSVVSVAGIITHGESRPLPLGPTIASDNAIIAALRSAAMAPTPAVLLYVNSPGGAALASELILDEVHRTARKKPVLAYVDRVAASGGYMAALGAKEIWAAPLAIVGSIGVFAGKFELSGLLEMAGVDRVVLQRGKNAAAFSVSRGFTDGERQALERDIEEMYQSFLAHVARARNRTVEQVHAVGEGRIFTGRRALDAGLIDRVGLFEEAVVRLLELSGVSTQDFELLVHGAARPWLPRVPFIGGKATGGPWALWYPWFELPGISDRPLLDGGGLARHTGEIASAALPWSPWNGGAQSVV